MLSLNFLEYLESHSKRIIPEYEIGLAILHCSIETFCNPCYKITQTMSLTVPTESADISIDLTDEQDSIAKTDTATLDLEIPETNEHLEINHNLVTSTPYCEPSNVNTNDSKEEESMPDICITETPAQDNQQKRRFNKVNSHDLDESDNEDLFQFQSKKPCLTKDDDKETTDITIPKESTKSISRNHLEEDKPTTSKAKLTQNVIFTNFLEKTQKQYTKNKSELSFNESDKSSTTTTRKRPHIQVLDENDDANDDEDLFSFGDTQKRKKSRGHEEIPNNDNEEEDLFGFKEKEKTKNNKQIKTFEIEDEDSNDLKLTQQFVVTEKSAKSSSVQMPKPKILPRKVSAMDWLTGSLCKIKIKNENSCIKKADDENVIKSETIKNENDLNITEDHRKWLESLNGAIQLHTFSLNNTITPNEKSHYVFKNRSNHNISENLDGTAKKNFKTFTKVNFSTIFILMNTNWLTIVFFYSNMFHIHKSRLL